MGAWAGSAGGGDLPRCKLRWASLDRAPHAEMLAFYRALIALRRRLPPLRNGRKDLARVEHDEAARWLSILRGDAGGAATFTAANLGDGPARIRVPGGTLAAGARDGRRRSPAAAARRHDARGSALDRRDLRTGPAVSPAQSAPAALR